VRRFTCPSDELSLIYLHITPLQPLHHHHSHNVDQPLSATSILPLIQRYAKSDTCHASLDTNTIALTHSLR
jgi:hypothetical protein